MNEQEQNKNNSKEAQENMADELLIKLKSLSGVKDLSGSDTDGLLQEILCYITARDLRVFMHGIRVGSKNARNNTATIDPSDHILTRPEESQPVL